jgi:hypothetical protein
VVYNMESTTCQEVEAMRREHGVCVGSD